ncbi:ABC transporter permease [bacterium]|nr:ABC transporter permease [bacterium]
MIGIILFLGAFLMTVGNSVINGAKQGMEENMIGRFTGHLVIKPGNQKENEVFTGGMTSLKILPDYPGIKKILKQQRIIESIAPMTRGTASVLNPDGNPGQIFVYGVNFSNYQETFLNNIKPSEGRLLDQNARGIIITEKIREKLYDRLDFWVVPQGLTKEETVLYRDATAHREFDVQDPKIVAEARKEADAGKLKTAAELIILGFGSNSFGNDIRVPVRGVFRFQNLNQIWKEAAFMDIESYREAFGHISVANQTVELTDRQKEVLNTKSEDMDDMFGSGSIVKGSSISTETVDLSVLKQKIEKTRTPVDIDQGAYNFVAIKLKHGVDLISAQKELQMVFDKAELPLKVLTWETAIGTISQFMSIGQNALFIFVLFIFFVAIIIIMNTLSMAAMERVTEIGMMRAVGAQKWFISKMFLMETFLLSFAFGGIGIIIGTIVTVILARLNIPVNSSEMLSLMFASDTFNPVITISTLLSGVAQLGIVTILAVLYPLYIARKITPMEAIARD